MTEGSAFVKGIIGDKADIFSTFAPACANLFICLFTTKCIINCPYQFIQPSLQPGAVGRG